MVCDSRSECLESLKLLLSDFDQFLRFLNPKLVAVFQLVLQHAISLAVSDDVVVLGALNRLNFTFPDNLPTLVSRLICTIICLKLLK